MPGKNRIALNGFGRIGRMMAQTLPILPHVLEAERRAMQNMIDEAQRRDTLEAERRIAGLDSDERQVYVLTRHADNTFTFHRPETAVTDVRVEDGPVYHERYWNRQFHKDYAKKKKAKRRQQNKSRRRNK